MMVLVLAACMEAPSPDVVAEIEVTEATIGAALGGVTDPWTEHLEPGDPLVAQVSEEQLAALQRAGFRTRVVIDDLDQAIEASMALTGGADFFDDWRDLDEFSEHLDDLVVPGLSARVELGQSIEGRSISGIKISAGSGPRPGILVTGAQHAREWVAAASAMYVAEQLVEGYGVDPEITDLLDTHQIVVVPIANPDGYRYTWTTDRLWRKNRRDNLDGSFGVDLNRNWGFRWGGVGSSGVTTSTNYRGTAEFSEPESTALANYLQGHPNFALHVDLHCTGQVVLYPWGFTPSPTEDGPAYELLGETMALSMEAEHGSSYNFGQWNTQLYPSSGTMIDWAYGSLGLTSVLFELRDRGQFGFLLPADQLRPTAEEAWAGFLELAASSESLRLGVAAELDGADVVIKVHRAQAGATVKMAWAPSLGSFTTADGTVLPLDAPTHIGSLVANANGAMRARWTPTASGAGWLVAYEPGKQSQPIPLTLP